MYKAIFFDFYRTLSPSDYFAHLEPAVQSQINKLVFSEKSEMYWEWLEGRKSSKQIAATLSEYIGLNTEKILKELEYGCKKISLSKELLEFSSYFRSLNCKVGIVTLNFDVFSSIIVPHFQLKKDFDFIINSSDIGTSDKRQLFLNVIETLNLTNNIKDCLLIDDDTRWIEAFQILGGQTKQFVNDEDFKAWRLKMSL